MFAWWDGKGWERMGKGEISGGFGRLAVMWWDVVV